MIPTIYALHGFLGVPSDWNLVGHIGGSCEALELFSISHPKNGLQEWGRALNNWIVKQPAERRILLGYSQGGRLAMHALIDAPELWAGAILISANTGLKSPKERSSRLQTDMHWAQRFLHDPWEGVIHDWNCQAAFQGRKPPFHRKEEDFVRIDLSHAIEEWSLGRQDDLQEPLSKLPFPILWIAGEKDLKYVELAKQMAALHSHSSFWVAPEAAHRVPWESPYLFLKEISSWIQHLFSH
jgi:2-succinyl-6-hydroxy-2,4-cyclohexadiene-1-carboxylate synthase